MVARLKKSLKFLRDMVLPQKKNSEEWKKVTEKVFKDLIEMNIKEFNLERKYLVLSLEDINQYLNEDDRSTLQQIVFTLRHHREHVEGREPLEGIFVKNSYPFYEDTFKKLEMYVRQKNRKEFSMVSLGGQQMLVLEDINPKRVNKGVCIKVTGKEEFIDAHLLEHIVEGGSAVLNLNEYHISSHPIKGDQIMIQVRERHNGFTHFFQTNKTSLKVMFKEVM
ncbi:hypothetical protein Silverhawkium_gp107 [Shigella phage Silverhawkium]|uniref:Uncharacterized protein n=1 Tax=Shigella phage Silverhawkium TaxID=2530185 RepID=A0A482JKC1_9CAUD|nr:hypothetical protein Silverhawkium_gp107 [Shigella phage Silverhawkium]